MPTKLARKDDSGTNIIAIAETAGNTQDLVVIQQCGLFDQTKQMNPIGPAPTRIEGECRFDVTIRSRSTQDTNPRRSHLPPVP
jgi:hypothetical protein